MWNSLCHDWDALKERNDLQRKLDVDEDMTVSVNISAEIVLKLAEIKD